MQDNKVQKVLIIGGGLVGSLCAIFMAKKDYDVTIFEYREDIRGSKLSRGRSINMVLSNRGRKALKMVGLEDIILESGVPMLGRYVHEINGRTRSIPFDSRTGQCTFSINRSRLNKVLLTELEKYPNTKIYFSHKLTSINFEEETVTLLNTKTQKEKTYHGDLIIGADGAYSTLRHFMQMTPMFDLHQTYITHGYIELQILPNDGQKMLPNHLHVWPRENYMMVAFPNLDHSWTLTLCMPFEIFTRLKTRELLIIFFKNNFPDALTLIGEDLLVDDFFKIKPSPLVSIECNRYYLGRKFLIIGDAAHAMVPFYGQGMNAGFQDCLIFDNILTKYDNVADSIRKFSEIRHKDCHAICKLSMYNYLEMRNLITKPSYYLRKTFDNFLFKLVPNIWVPLYFSVVFTDMGYQKCIENREWQNKIITWSVWMGVFLIIAVGTYFIA